jgi:phosphoribosyl 1,2-cyclic phosphodiesterase
MHGLAVWPQQFQIAAKRNHVNVLTYTHNDSDHANGVLGLLKAGLTADEVWLPASWMGRLEDLILYPRDF